MPTPLQSAALIITIIVGVLAVVGQVITLTMLAKTRSAAKEVQKREVTFGAEFVTKEVCISRHENTVERVAKVEQEVAALRDLIREDRNEQTTLMLAEVKAVHNRVNLVGDAVAKLGGKIDGLRKVH